MTKRFLPLITLIALAFAEWVPAAKASVPQGEWIILVGGVSLNQWEKYKAQPHDHWWRISCTPRAFGLSNCARSLDRT